MTSYLLYCHVAKRLCKRRCVSSSLCQEEHESLPHAMLAYVRKDEAGKLVYLLALGRMSNWVTFDSHAQAFDYAVAHQMDFVHQPWSSAIDDRIRETLQGREQ